MPLPLLDVMRRSVGDPGWFAELERRAAATASAAKDKLRSMDKRKVVAGAVVGVLPLLPSIGYAAAKASHKGDTRSLRAAASKAAAAAAVGGVATGLFAPLGVAAAIGSAAMASNEDSAALKKATGRSTLAGLAASAGLLDPRMTLASLGGAYAAGYKAYEDDHKETKPEGESAGEGPHGPGGAGGAGGAGAAGGTRDTGGGPASEPDGTELDRAYATLGAEKGDKVQATKKYKELMRKLHPDKNLETPEESTEQAKRINAAYEIIKNSKFGTAKYGRNAKTRPRR
jgi:DnaJ-domain-containing protein 1